MNPIQQQNNDTNGRPRAQRLDPTTYIGGSDAPIICGVSPWSTAYELWHYKTGRVQRERKESPYMAAGIALERTIARELADRHGLRIRKRTRPIRSPNHPWIAGHVDFEVLDSPPRRRCGVFEVKNTNEFMRSKWGDPEDGIGGIPTDVLLQVDHYMLACSDYEFGLVGLCIGGWDFRLYRVERDEDRLRELLEAESDFWYDHVLLDTPPEPDWAHPSTVKFVAAKYPGVDEIEDPTICTDKRIVDISAEHDRLKAMLPDKEEPVKALKARIDELKSELRDFMGTRPLLTLPDGTYWRRSLVHRSESVRTIPAKDYTTLKRVVPK